MSKSFLDLVTELYEEVGAAGKAPITVANQTGEAKRIINWVKRANTDIQNLWLNWKFLRKTFSQVTTINSNTLPVPVDFGDGMWDDETFFVTQAGDTVQSPLICQEYDEVKREVLDTSPGVPWRVVLMPDNSLRFEGTPDGAHLIQADYFREPNLDELTVDADFPSIPNRFYRAIIGRALIYYGNYENAPEFKQQGQEVFTDYLARLENSQLDNKKKSRFRTGGEFTVVAE